MRVIPYMAILAELTSDEVLDTAYDWLCRRRRDYPANADVWSFRQDWAREKDRLKAALAADLRPSRSALASLRRRVSKPSAHQPYIGCGGRVPHRLPVMVNSFLTFENDYYSDHNGIRHSRGTCAYAEVNQDPGGCKR